jgi:hypothetical protein
LCSWRTGQRIGSSRPCFRRRKRLCGCSRLQVPEHLFDPVVQLIELFEHRILLAKQLANQTRLVSWLHAWSGENRNGLTPARQLNGTRSILPASCGHGLHRRLPEPDRAWLRLCKRRAMAGVVAPWESDCGGDQRPTAGPPGSGQLIRFCGAGWLDSRPGLPLRCSQVPDTSRLRLAVRAGRFRFCRLLRLRHRE